MRKLAAGVLAVVAAAGVLLLLIREKPSQAGGSAPRSVPPAVDSPPAPPVPAPAGNDLLDAASRLLKEGKPAELQALAAEWRRSARGDPAFLNRLISLVLDENADKGVREIAAYVLGSIPDPKALESLSRALDAARDPRWIRALLLALGSDRTSDDDDIFDLPDSPRVLSTPAGLSVRIRGAVEDPAIRTRMIPHLRGHGEAGVRWAAALALADSARFPDVRGAFLDSVRAEREAAAQGEAAKALADWAAGEPADSADRLRVFTAIFEEADRSDAAALRLRSEDGMKRMPWTAAEVRLMAGRIEAGSLDQKRWAIAVLAGAASQPEIPDRAIIFEAIARASSSAPEAKVREFAVTGLGSFANEARASELLVGSLKDTAWHVRAAAVRALGRVKRTPEVQAALQRVEREDPDERVRRAAGEVRKAD